MYSVYYTIHITKVHHFYCRKSANLETRFEIFDIVYFRDIKDYGAISKSSNNSAKLYISPVTHGHRQTLLIFKHWPFKLLRFAYLDALAL